MLNRRVVFTYSFAPRLLKQTDHHLTLVFAPALLKHCVFFSLFVIDGTLWDRASSVQRILLGEISFTRRRLGRSPPGGTPLGAPQTQCD
jgi:hypothetical protein